MTTTDDHAAHARSPHPGSRPTSWRAGWLHVRGPRLPLGRGLAVIAFCAAAVVGGAWYAWDGSVAGWEKSVLVFFNDFPDWLDAPMWFVQQPGVLLFPIFAGAVIVALTRRWHYALAFALLPAFKLLIEKRLVKGLVDRSRPFTSIGPEIRTRGSSLLDEPSFPSGHTTTAIATAWLIAAFLPRRWRPVPLVWGVLVGIGRLYYGEHNTLDVICGAALGTAFAAIVWLVFLNRWVGDGPATSDTIAES